MSIDATRWVWKLTKDQVTPTEKLLLLAIADRCGEEGECWPSISRLVRDTGYHRDAVIQNRKSLIGKGVLSLTGDFKGRSKQIPIMKLMCNDWRKGDENDDNFLYEIDQSSRTTGRQNTLLPVVLDDTYQSSRTTQNLKEEPKRLNISTACELPNPGYTKSDEKLPKKEKPDYFLPLREPTQNISQVSEIEVQILRSDYCDYKTNSFTESKSKELYGVKNLLSENIFQIPDQIITDWVENRKKKRAPITQTAWNKITKELTKCKEQGIEPIEAFETMVASGWQSLKVEYFVNGKDLSAKRDEAKRQSLELEERTRRMKQQEIDNAKRFNPIVRKACENERLKLRQAIGSRAPETIPNHRRAN